MTENTNPLNKYFRQPAIYVSLPSGTDYPPHVITPAQTGELGVMPMTAKDEIRFKTPDALMNGQGEGFSRCGGWSAAGGVASTVVLCPGHTEAGCLELVIRKWIVRV